MAYKIVWSPIARDDLRDLVRYIATDNPQRAASFGMELIGRIEKLQNFPELGRIVPERKDPNIREIVARPYRVIYRLSREIEALEIVRIWHGARGEPELFVS